MQSLPESVYFYQSIKSEHTLAPVSFRGMHVAFVPDWKDNNNKVITL